MCVKPQEWDSSFFGYPVASASFKPSPVLIPEIYSALEKARDTGVRLLYLFIPKVGDALRVAIEQAGAKAVGQKVEYAKAVCMPPPSALGKDIALCHMETAQLERLAIQSGIHSRFHLDNGFQNHEFERLYREWLRSSLLDTSDKRVYVAGNSTAPCGFITLELGSSARIGLIAVDAAQRGKGLGTQLIAEAERFCFQNKVAEIRVATQMANSGACRFYEKYGFKKRSEVDIFHAWLMTKKTPASA